MVEINFSAVVLCEAVAARYLLSAAHFALRTHVPVPDVIVTVVPLTEQAPVAVITAFVLAFVVAVTVNVDWYGALAGAPVNVTVGGIFALLGFAQHRKTTMKGRTQTQCLEFSFVVGRFVLCLPRIK